MTISEKIKHSLPNEIHFYKEGVFWVAYEQSAFAICKIKSYKPTKKFVKAAGMEVVSAGFPANALALVVSGIVASGGKQIEPLPEADQGMHIVLQTKDETDQMEFLEWKNAINIRQNENNSCGQTSAATISVMSEKVVVERIKTFDLSIATPMDCMMFIHALKKEL
jgi:hypothetical protein